MRKSKGGDDYKKTGKISGIKALSIACGAAIGVGNIGGVASAIALGGPGVLFWMWVTALVGMLTKCVEVTLLFVNKHFFKNDSRMLTSLPCQRLILSYC